MCSFYMCCERFNTWQYFKSLSTNSAGPKATVSHGLPFMRAEFCPAVSRHFCAAEQLCNRTKTKAKKQHSLLSAGCAEVVSVTRLLSSVSLSKLKFQLENYITVILCTKMCIVCLLIGRIQQNYRTSNIFLQIIPISATSCPCFCSATQQLLNLNLQVSIRATPTHSLQIKTYQY